MYINDLTDVLVDCHVHMYADDVQLYSSTRKENIDSYLHSINRNLDRIMAIMLRHMDYVLIPQSSNVLCSRKPIFDLLGSATNLGIAFNNRLS